MCCFGNCQSGVVLHGTWSISVGAREVFIQELRGAFPMRIYHSVCPGCGHDVERGYGEMGEGLLYEEGCRCRVDLALGDWLVIGLVVLAGLVLGLG